MSHSSAPKWLPRQALFQVQSCSLQTSCGKQLNAMAQNCIFLLKWLHIGSVPQFSDRPGNAQGVCSHILPYQNCKNWSQEHPPGMTMAHTWRQKMVYEVWSNHHSKGFLKISISTAINGGSQSPLTREGSILWPWHLLKLVIGYCSVAVSFLGTLPLHWDQNLGYKPSFHWIYLDITSIKPAMYLLFFFCQNSTFEAFLCRLWSRALPAGSTIRKLHLGTISINSGWHLPTPQIGSRAASQQK